MSEVSDQRRISLGEEQDWGEMATVCRVTWAEASSHLSKGQERQGQKET
jgi:hypothetical protein